MPLAASLVLLSLLIVHSYVSKVAERKSRERTPSATIAAIASLTLQYMLILPTDESANIPVSLIVSEYS
jgi:hypothetical protein